MVAQGTSVFDGLPAEELEAVLGTSDQRSVAAGAILIREGATLQAVYVLQAGTAEILATDRQGREHSIGRVGAGAILGEMAFFTGQPATATVRANSAVDLLVLSRDEFHRLAVSFPRIYRNLATILAERLAKTNRRVVNVRPGQITILIDGGSPPLLGYALACSVAWHTRSSTLLVVVTDTPAPELVRLSGLSAEPEASARPSSGPARVPATPPSAGARLLIAASSGAYAPDRLARTLEELCDGFDHVLVQVQETVPAQPANARQVRLVGADPHPAENGDLRPEYTLQGWVTSRLVNRPGSDRLIRVPPLSAGDEESLRGGALPLGSAAGRALGWLARELTGLMVGLALGAGGAKGYAHVGVLHMLRRHKIPVDCVAGTSVGAAVAALFAAGRSHEEVLRRIDEVGSQAFRPTVSINGLLSSNGLRAGLRKVSGSLTFDELELPLAVVAADILTRQEVVFQRGLVWPAVLASMSIPGIYPPQRMAGHMLVDGGILNPVPTSAVIAMGANIAIGVTLGSRAGPPTTAAAETKVARRSPSFLQAITRTIDLMQSKIGEDAAARATILIEPLFSPDDSWSLRHFTRGRRFVPLGEAAAERSLAQLAARLPWLR